MCAQREEEREGISCTTFYTIRLQKIFTFCAAREGHIVSFIGDLNIALQSYLIHYGSFEKTQSQFQTI